MCEPPRESAWPDEAQCPHWDDGLVCHCTLPKGHDGGHQYGTFYRVGQPGMLIIWNRYRAAKKRAREEGVVS